MKKQPGFTLMELLVTIGILAILASLLFPLGSKMIEKSKTVGCAANLKLIGQALHLYAGENDNYAPPGYVKLDDGTRSTWFGGVAPYLARASGEKPTTNIANVRYCPATSVKGEGIYLRDKATWRTDYACNALLFVGTSSGNSINRRKMSDYTGQTIVAYDGLQSGTPAKTNACARHGTRINTLFLDGHVELLAELPEEDVHWKQNKDIVKK